MMRRCQALAIDYKSHGTFFILSLQSKLLQINCEEFIIAERIASQASDVRIYKFVCVWFFLLVRINRFMDAIKDPMAFA